MNWTETETMECRYGMHKLCKGDYCKCDCHQEHEY